MGKLRIFLKWLEDSHCPLDAELLRVDHLRSFMAYLREVKADANNPYKPSSNASLSSRTIQGYARTLRAFFSWFEREGHLAESPARLLRIPKAAKTIVSTLTPDQIGWAWIRARLERSNYTHLHSVLAYLTPMEYRLSHCEQWLKMGQNSGRLEEDSPFAPCEEE